MDHTTSWRPGVTRSPFCKESFGTLEKDRRRSTNTYRLSGMKRVIILQTNRLKQTFHLLHTWDFRKNEFYSHSETFYYLWRRLKVATHWFQYQIGCIREMLPVRMFILRITINALMDSTKMHLLVISILFATFTYAGKRLFQSYKNFT